MVFDIFVERAVQRAGLIIRIAWYKRLLVIEDVIYIASIDSFLTVITNKIQKYLLEVLNPVTEVQ